MRFCVEEGKTFSLLKSVEEGELEKEQAFILLTEADLAVLIRKCRQTRLSLGVDVGILSYNETVLKELLNISVFTTDFYKMGEAAANLIVNNHNEQLKNPHKLILRGSL